MSPIYISILRPVPQYTDYCSFELGFETGKHACSNFVHFIKIILAILGLLHFHVCFKVSLAISVIKTGGVWQGWHLIYISSWGVLPYQYYLLL